MTTPDPDAMEERLKYLADTVSAWLRYAETKNAGLLVASGTVLKFAADSFPTPAAGQFCLWSRVVGMFIIGLAAAVCLVSFVPTLKFEWLVSKAARSATHNLFYFGHIAIFSAFEYLTALYQAEGLSPANRKIEIDLAGQIVTNSQITARKFLQFKAAVWFALIGVIVLAASWIAQLRSIK